MRIWLIGFVIGVTNGAPIIQTANNTMNDRQSSTFLTEKDARPITTQASTSTGNFLQMMESVVNDPIMGKVWSFIENFTGNAMQKQGTIVPEISAMQDEMPHVVQKAEGVSTSKIRSHTRILRDETPKVSLNRDLASQDDSLAMSSGKITDQAWSKTLFGERGVLTEIFHVFDEQRRAAEANSNHPSQSDQSDSAGKIGSNDVDLKKIFDSIFSSSPSGQFGDPGPELPEFLGICNRLSCGDIYKAIDQFRKSEFFSNFQTALQLIQDPKGWEIIGKALENPEMISEFAGNSGLKEMFGSALGESDKEKTKANERKKTEILPEDGDFGTDFTEIVDGLKPKNKLGEKPDISFSIDKNGDGDYYSQLSKSTDGDEDRVDHVDVEIQVPKGAVIEPVEKPIPPSKKIEKSGADSLPELSFSEDGEEEMVNVDGGEEMVVVEKSIDIMPPKKLIDVRVSPPSTTPSTTAKPQQQRVIRLSNTTQSIFSSTTRTARRITIKSSPRSTTIPTTTRRNYRKDDDYYAMYYDH
ncbi:unnamed protein product, partial [Mesorhabditis belari]|uniref:Uncharacterized protein n=1 Tax=Mesorhabditis belari TaxID=2138241 RepID=A0AAF3F6U8_9BILA